MGHTSVPEPWHLCQPRLRGLVSRRGAGGYDPTRRVPASLGCITHLWGGGCPRGGSGGVWVAATREGAAGTELGTPRPPRQPAKGIALEVALAVPRAWAALPARPRGLPASHPPPATVPVPAPHRQPAVAPPREEAPPGAPAPDNGRPPYRGAFCEGWAMRPPAALIGLGRWPRLGSQPPPFPRHRSPPWHPPLRPRGRPLGSVPPLSFLKFKIHLSQEEGKLLPLKPLALSGKSSLPRRRRLLAPGDSREGGARLLLPASRRAGRQRGAPCAPLQRDQRGVRLPLSPQPLQAGRSIPAARVPLVWTRKGVLLMPSMPRRPQRCGTPLSPHTRRGLRPTARELDAFLFDFPSPELAIFKY